MQIFVERYRLEKGYTLKDLSKRAGVAASHIHYIENGHRVPTLTIL